MRSKPFQLLGGSDFNMTRMVKLIGTTLVAATLAALTGLLVAGGQSLVLAQANTPATGAPVIEGAAQLDERMLARTSGRISDADGMTNSRFSYQWISNDGTTDTDIEGATSSSYTIVAADAGKTIKVRVSFTDDAGNPEALTSAPTGVVSGERNSPTMGLPTIGGTAKVGQKLTVNTSGIADADGLTNASYGGTWSAGGGYLRALIGQGNDLSYTVSRRDVGMTLDMTVNFKDDAGKSIFLTSAPTAVVVATSPAAPENFDVSQNSDGDLELSWEEPTWDLGGEIGGEKTWGDGGSAITGYVVQWKEAADSWDTVGDVSEATVTGTTHTIEGLTDGVAYTIKVIAVNDVGRGASSDEATATINLPVSPPLSTDATLSAPNAQRHRLRHLRLDNNILHGAGSQQRGADDRYAGSERFRGELPRQARRGDGRGLGDCAQRGQQHHHRGGDRRGHRHHPDLHRDRQSRCAALDRRNPQRPRPERGRLRDIRLDNRLIHSHRRQQRISDDRYPDREPLRGELRHQARRGDGRRR